jgi:Peptidase family C78
MSKLDQENVIDLCHSSDEDDALPHVHILHTHTSLSSCCSNPYKTKSVLGHCHSNPYHVKKKSRLEIPPKCFTSKEGIECTSNYTATTISKQKSIVIFIDGGGMDNAIVTDGIVTLLNNVPNTRSCADGQGRECLTMLHIQQHDAWSCGFRNLQMMLSSMLPTLPKSHSYFQRQNDSREEGYCSIPSLRQLQELMEMSWAAGYDRSGAEHFHYKMVGLSKWIGAVEVSNLLTFSGIENTVIEFILCHESRSLLSQFCSLYFSRVHQKHLPSCCHWDCSKTTGFQNSQVLAQQLLLMDYEYPELNLIHAETISSCGCPLLPLYLQWNGHSVTVVGIETTDKGDSKHAGEVKNLLVLDPGVAGSILKKSLLKRDSKPLRLPISKLIGKDCQIVMASTQALSLAEQDQLKTRVRSVTAAYDAVMRVRKYQT